MADPSGSVEVLEWAKVVVTSLGAGISAAWAWIRGTRAEIDLSIGVVSKRVELLEGAMMKSQTESAVMRTNLDNHVDRLNEIRETTRDTNEKLDNLANQMTQVLLAVKHH